MRLSVLVFLLFSAFSAGAADQYASPNGYAELALNLVPQSVAEQDFRLVSAEIRGGAYLRDLVAVEGFVSQGIADDDDAGLTQTINLGYGAGLRFESPSRDGVKAFILLGYSSHELELMRNDGTVLAEDRFDSFAYGVGFEQQLGKGRSPLFLNARWQRHYASGEVVIDTAGVALRYAF